MRIVVVFPAPLGPMKPKISPFATERFRWSTARVLPYRLVRFVNSIIVAISRISSFNLPIRPDQIELTVGLAADETDVRHVRRHLSQDGVGRHPAAPVPEVEDIPGVIKETAAQIDHPRLHLGRYPGGPGEGRQQDGVLVAVPDPVFQRLQGVRNRKDGSLLQVLVDPGHEFFGLHSVRIAGSDDFGHFLPDLRVIRLNEGGGFEKRRKISGGASRTGGRVGRGFAPDRQHTVPIGLAAAVEKEGTLRETLQTDLQDLQGRGILDRFRRGDGGDLRQIRADRAFKSRQCLLPRDPLQDDPQDPLFPEHRAVRIDPGDLLHPHEIDRQFSGLPAFSHDRQGFFAEEGDPHRPLPERGRIENRKRPPLPRLESLRPDGLQDAPAQIGRLRKSDDADLFLARSADANGQLLPRNLSPGRELEKVRPQIELKARERPVGFQLRRRPDRQGLDNPHRIDPHEDILGKAKSVLRSGSRSAAHSRSSGRPG